MLLTHFSSIYVIGRGEIVFTCPSKDKIKLRSYPIFPDFRKSITFLKIPRSLPLVLLVTAACRWCVQLLRSPKEAFAAAMQSWRERCEKCVCLQGDYVEK